MKPLSGNKFKNAEFSRNLFAITPPPGVTIEDMKKREYWTNVAKFLKQFSRIEVMPRDGSFFAEFVVTSAGPNWANVVLRDFVELDNFKPAIEDTEFSVKLQGGDDGWAVIRNSDKVVLGNGFDTSDDAKTWLESYKITE